MSTSKKISSTKAHRSPGNRGPDKLGRKLMTAPALIAFPIFIAKTRKGESAKGTIHPTGVAAVHLLVDQNQFLFFRVFALSRLSRLFLFGVA